MSTFAIFMASLVMAATFGFGVVPSSIIRETKPPTPIEKQKGDPVLPGRRPPADTPIVVEK